MEEGFFSRLLQSRARGYMPEEQPVAATPPVVRANPYQDVIDSRGAAARNAIEMMRGGNLAGGLGSLVGSIAGSAFNRPTPSMEPVGRFVGGVFGGGEMPRQMPNNTGFTSPDQIANLPTSNDLQSLMIRPIGGSAAPRPAAPRPAAPPAASALPPGVSMSPYDTREDRAYQQIRVLRGGQPTDYTVRRYDQPPSAERPDYERIDGNLFYRDRSAPGGPVLRRLRTDQEQAGLRAASLEGLLKQAEILQKGGQGRKYAAEAGQAAQNVQFGDLAVRLIQAIADGNTDPNARQKAANDLMNLYASKTSEIQQLLDRTKK
jgi:hypothetical protein